MKRLALALVSVFFLLLPIVRADTYLTDCAELNVTGETYYLTQDIINSTATFCMNIKANNIVLDCQGHTIDGVDSNFGIWCFRGSSEITNITIKNCALTDWDTGIGFTYSDSNILSNITANSNSVRAIIFSNSSSNTLTDIIANYNRFAIWLENSSSNTINNSIIQDNTDYGIYLTSSAGSLGANIIYNNLFNNTNNFGFTGDIYANNWNTTRQTGTRIYSAGIEIGGNYWTNSAGNGYSDTCTDANHDGFCDTTYIIDPGQTGNNTDYLPLSDEYNTAPKWSSNISSIPTNYDSSTYSWFNVTWTDDNDANGYNVSLIEINYTGVLTNYTTLRDGNVSYFKIILGAGTYQWRFYANDSSNAWNSTNIWYATINKATPALTLTASPSWSVLYGLRTTVTGSESNLGDADLSYKLYRDNSLVSNPDVATLAVGSYSYVYNSTSGQNYTANSVSNNLTVSAPVSGVPLLSRTLVGIAIGFGVLAFMLKTLFDIREPKKVVEYFIALAVIVLTVLSLIVLFA
jgi:parallel beta-helix repeat protein